VSDHDVRRLEITVDDAARVGVVDALAHLEKDIEQTPEAELGERLGIARLSLLEDRLERLTAYELHREVGAPIGIDAEIVDGDDVRVLELGGDLRLFHEAGEEPRRELI